MTKIRKVLIFSINTILLFTAVLCSITSAQESLRLEVGSGDDTLERIREDIARKKSRLTPQSTNLLLAEEYIMHDIAVKEVVNPNDKELIGAYGCCGADFFNVFKSTNADTVYFIERVPIDKNALKYYWEERWNSLEYEEDTEDPRAWTISNYNSFKYTHGYAEINEIAGGLLKGHKVALAIARELKALGISMKDIIDIKENKDGNIEISFNWAYDENSSRRTRKAIFINEDIIYTSEKLNQKLKGKLDFYYHRAAMTVPEKYPLFIKTVEQWIKPLGFMITDDRNADNEYSEPDLDGFKLIQPTENMELWAKKIEDFQFGALGRKDLYGWSVSIRQKIKTEHPNIPIEIEDIRDIGTTL